MYVWGDKVVFSLYEFKSMFGLFQGVRISQIDMCDAKLEQYKFSNRFKILKNKKTVGKNYKKYKKVTIKNVEKWFRGRNETFNKFKNFIFSYSRGHQNSEGNFYDLADSRNLSAMQTSLPYSTWTWYWVFFIFCELNCRLILTWVEGKF